MFESPPVEAGVAGGRKGSMQFTSVPGPRSEGGARLRERCLDGCYENRLQTDEPETRRAPRTLEWGQGGGGAGGGRDTGGPPLRRPRRTRNEEPSEKQGAMRPIAGQTSSRNAARCERNPRAVSESEATLRTEFVPGIRT